jgi:site-specific recombinase XerC
MPLYFCSVTCFAEKPAICPTRFVQNADNAFLLPYRLRKQEKHSYNVLKNRLIREVQGLLGHKNVETTNDQWWTNDLAHVLRQDWSV